MKNKKKLTSELDPGSPCPRNPQTLDFHFEGHFYVVTEKKNQNEHTYWFQRTSYILQIKQPLSMRSDP